MKNNKILIYISLLVAGMLFGWLFFGGTSDREALDNDNEVSVANQRWTCSMHPQIMQPEPGDCPICGMDLIPAEAGADGLQADQFKLSDNAMALANIQTTAVGMAIGGDNIIKLSGKIAENEEANAVQVSYFSGRIERLNVSFTGEEVRKGQILATIYSPELYAAQQELITAAALKNSQPALYQAVRNKLKLWKLSENQITQIETSGKVRRNFPVYATVSGTVSEKLVEQGASVKQGQPLLKIANLNTVWANFDVYENQIKHFKKGQQVTITTTAYPNNEFKGKVDFIDPVLNTRTRTVTLRVVLNNKNNLFKPGMFVKGEIEGHASKNNGVLLIPSTAVLWTGERSVVYLKANPDQPVFEMRAITLGNQIGETYEVFNGLNNGDEIVTNGTFTVDAAAQLQGKKSMMNQNGGKVITGHEDHLGMQDATSQTIDDQPNTNTRIKVSKRFQHQLKAVFNAYSDLKDALIEEDSKSVATHASVVLTHLNTVDMKLLTDANTHDKWMVLEKTIKSSANEIAMTSNIKAQRRHFKQLSHHLITAIQIFGIGEQVYSQFCPMADGDTGAYWLSKEEKVLNPYFGNAMLTCGSVKQKIN